MAYIGKQPLVGNYTVLDPLTATTTDTYALTKGAVAVYPHSPANCIVSLNGVIQAPFDSYTISGSNIVFASALTASDSIDFITVLGDVLNVGTVSDGTIGLNKLSATGTPSSSTFLRGDNTWQSAGGTNTPYFRAYQTGTSQNLGSGGAWTKLQMNTETVDSAGAYDTSNYRFTPQTAGYYFITGAVVTYNGSYTYRWQQVAIYKNGNQYNRSTIDYNNSNCYGAGLTVNAFVYLNGSTDYVEFYCRAYANGNTVNIDEDTTSSYWSGFKIIE